MPKKVTYRIGYCYHCGERGFVYRYGAWLVCSQCIKKLQAAVAARRRPLD